MGYLRTSLSGIAIASLAACGSDGSSKQVDAPAAPDAPPDAAPDAPIDAVVYDFSCSTNQLPTTAPATITLGGIVATLSQGGGTPVADATVEVFKRGVAAPIAKKTSDAQGAWASGDLTTGGVPLDAFVHVAHDDVANPATTYRSTYIFSPQAFAASIPAIPTPIVTAAIFAQIAILASPAQDDTANGVVLVNLLDCAGTRVGDATVAVKKSGAPVGQVVDVGQLLPQARGVYVVFNVPDGEVDVGASVNTMSFQEHKVRAVKASMGVTPDKNGTVTTTIVRPGPP